MEFFAEEGGGFWEYYLGLIEDHSWGRRRRVELRLGDGGKCGDHPEDEDDTEERMDGEGSQSRGV